MDKEANVTRRLAMMFGAKDRAGSGAAQHRVDSAGQHEFTSFNTGFDLLEKGLRYRLDAYREDGIIRNDDFSAALGGTEATDLTFRIREAFTQALPPLQGREVFYQDRRIPPGYLEYRQYRTWMTGQAVVYAGGLGTDVPKVGIGKASAVAPIHYLVSSATIDFLENMRAGLNVLDQTPEPQ